MQPIPPRPKYSVVLISNSVMSSRWHIAEEYWAVRAQPFWLVWKPAWCLRIHWHEEYFPTLVVNFGLLHNVALFILRKQSEERVRHVPTVWVACEFSQFVLHFYLAEIFPGWTNGIAAMVYCKQLAHRNSKCMPRPTLGGILNKSETRKSQWRLKAVLYSRETLHRVLVALVYTGHSVQTWHEWNTCPVNVMAIG